METDRSRLASSPHCHFRGIEGSPGFWKPAGIMERSPVVRIISVPWLDRFCGSRFLHASVLAVAFGGALGAATSLETGSGDVLSSATVPLGVPDVPWAGVVFEFGFSTDEVPTPGAFADSFTLSLENPQGQRLYLATADAFGVNWAPTVPGSFPLPQAELRYSTVPYDSSVPERTFSVSYRVEVTVPPVWVPGDLQLRLDLFDNLNPIRSIGYVTAASVVPEPGVLGLVGLGLLGPLFWRRF